MLCGVASRHRLQQRRHPAGAVDHQDPKHAGKGSGWEISVHPLPLVISMGTEHRSKNKSLKIKQKSDPEDRHKCRRLCGHIHQDEGETSSSKMETSGLDSFR